MITNETIDEVKNRIDIVDVIGDFVTLKKSGQNYKAHSPFNNEKTPSFYVVPTKGIFKDFSSGKGGDAITFVMEHEGLSYLEAIRYLAGKYGVEIKEHEQTADQQAERSSRESLYILMNYAREYYSDLLLNDEEGQSIALSYFKERGFNERTIRHFDLGYSRQEWDHFSKKAISQGYRIEMLDKAGLIVNKDNGKFYDRFRGRVIFPVHNLSGKIIAFGARILTKDKNQPKYINSPETEIYHKSQALYGMFQAKNAIRKEDFCYLVEGYTDVISMYQAGIENVVASSGTALTEEQIRLIRRFSENITVLFDGDAAGIKAALRGIDLVLKGGLNVRVVLLPDGEDPDSYSKKLGSTAFQEYLKTHSKDFISFKIDLLAADVANDPIKKAGAIREIVTSISVIPDPIKRSVYTQETSTLLKISEGVLLTELNKVLIQERKKEHQEQEKQQERAADAPLMVEDILEESRPNDISDMVQLQERERVRLLLNYAESKLEEDIDLISYFIHEFEGIEFLNDIYREIYQTFLDAWDDNRQLDAKDFMKHPREEVRNLVAELTLQKYHVSPLWRNKYKIIFDDEQENIKESAHNTVLLTKYRKVQELLEENIKALKMAEENNRHEEIDELIEKQMRLKNADKELAEQLGIVSGKY